MESTISHLQAVATSRLLPDFVNKVLLTRSHARSFPCTVAALGPVTAKWSSYDRDPVARRLTSVYHVALYRKTFADVALEGDSGPWGRTAGIGRRPLHASKSLVRCLITYCVHGALSRGAEL